MTKNFSTAKNFQNGHSQHSHIPTFDIGEASDPKNEEMENALKIINDALSVCRDEPGGLMADEFIKAYEFVKKTDKKIGAEIRVKIKREKPSGILMSHIDESSDSKEGGSGGDNVASELIEIVTQNGKLFYDGKTERGYVTVDIDGIQETMAINGKQFVDWLSYKYYAATGQSASEAAIKQAKFALSGIAKYDGKKQRIYLRVADNNDGHYIFLADEQLRVVEVSSTGWLIVNDPSVKFWKPAAMQPLPIPRSGGNLDLLWKFVNVDENDRPLLLAWMLESFRSETPKPVLSLNGTQGSAKSSTQNKIRQLVDNNAVNLRSAPKSTQDIFVSAGCNWLISYENLSHLSAQTQDAFCTLATGGGFASRTLYSDDDETVIDAKRPVIINSIPNVITAQDLTDRAVCLELPQIAYKEEVAIQKEWEAAMPAIFGGLLDLFVETLQQIPHVKLTNPPRMADFTRLGEAMMQAQGKSSGEFTKLYRANLDEGISRAVESSPAALAIIEMAEVYAAPGQIFYGTAKTLLERLTNDHKHDSESWPKSARGLTEVLRRQSPALARFGLHVTIGKKKERIGKSQGFPVTVKRIDLGNVGMSGMSFSKEFAEKKSFSEGVRV